MAATHRGQYHGAGVFTGFGLRFRHLAQRYRLPFTAVLGRCRLPVFGMFLGTVFSGYLKSPMAIALSARPIVPQRPNTTNRKLAIRPIFKGINETRSKVVSPVWFNSGSG